MAACSLGRTVHGVLYESWRDRLWCRHKRLDRRVGAKLAIGANSHILPRSVSIEPSPGAELQVGASVALRMFTTVSVRERVVTRDDAVPAELVTIRDRDHAVKPGIPRRLSRFISAPIHMGKNVWFGNMVTVTRGFSIGDNSMVATSDRDESLVEHLAGDCRLASERRMTPVRIATFAGVVLK